jgi:hypothetical protein
MEPKSSLPCSGYSVEVTGELAECKLHLVGVRSVWWDVDGTEAAPDFTLSAKLGVRIIS